LVIGGRSNPTHNNKQKEGFYMQLVTLRRILCAIILVAGFAPAATAFNHSVVRGDTLTGIAVLHCSRSAEYRRIAKENGVTNPNLIHVGQALVVTCQQGSQAVRVNTVVIVGNSGARVDTVKIVSPGAGYVSGRANASTREVEEYVYNKFGPVEAQIALPVFKAESSLSVSAVGYNCYYWSWSKGRKVSQACAAEDRHKAWSVDCGVAQINHRGQECPARLLTLEGSVDQAKRMFDERGWQPWVAYNRGLYRKYLNEYRGYSPGKPALMFAGSTPATSNPHARVDTVTVTYPQRLDTVRLVQASATDTVRIVNANPSATMQD
jgi:hypothetical protein